MSAFKQRLANTLAVYPESPRYKAPGASQQAARRIVPLVTGLRAKVLRSLREDGPGTPDEIAERLGFSILSVRPRFSELNRLGLIEQSNERRTNDSGHRADVWRIADHDRS